MKTLLSRKSLLKIAIAAAVAAGAICLYPAVGSAVSGGSAPENVVITITAGLSDKNIPITVQAGAQFTITLQSNITTGYSWRIKKDPNPKILKFVSSNYIKPTSGAMGRGCTEIWTFQAIAKGSQSITMEYARPWEKNVKPSKSQTFLVAIQ